MTAAIANTASTVVTYASAIGCGVVGGPVGPEAATICGVVGYIGTSPLRLASNWLGTTATGTSIIADAKGGVTGTDTVRGSLYTAVGWLDPEPLSATLVDYDTVWSDWEALQDSLHRGKK